MSISAQEEPYSPFPFPAEPDGIDPSVLETFLAFRKLVDTFNYLVQKDLSQGGTQPAQMAVLRLLASNDGLSQRHIAETMRLSRARVTTILQSMEKAGLIRRTRDPRDKRFSRVHLTELGRSLDREKSVLREEHVNNIFGDIPEEARAELIRCFDDLTLRLQRRLQHMSSA